MRGLHQQGWLGQRPGLRVIPTASASDRWARGAMRGPRALIGGVADRRRGAMTVAVTRKELGAAELRREAGRCRDARAARRMLALALVLEGGLAGGGGAGGRHGPADAPGLGA